MDQGERFAFHELHTELRVSVAGRLALRDRFSFNPDENIASSPANFAGYQTVFYVFLVGPPDGLHFQQLAALLQEQKMAGGDAPHFTLHSRRVAGPRKRVDTTGCGQ